MYPKCLVDKIMKHSDKINEKREICLNHYIIRTSLTRTFALLTRKLKILDNINSIFEIEK